MVSVPRRTTPAHRVAALAVGVLVAAGAGGCTQAAGPAGSPEQEQQQEQPSRAPLSAYGSDGPQLVLGGPCTEVSAESVADALGAAAETSLTWAPGQRLPGSPEVADEYGCRHTAGDVTASAWVFAVPTSRGQARRLAKEVTGPRCRRLRGAETYGDPGVAFTCEPASGPTLTGYRGLVGTSWVACEIAGTDDDERVGRWCAAVLESLSAS